MLLEPSSSGLGASVGEQVNNLVALAVSKNGAEDLTPPKGKVVDTKYAGCRASRRGGSVSAPE
jgi:hypothetical protein